MIESSSVRRALSLVREEISPTRDDKARLRARIVLPAALTAQESGGQNAAQRAAAARGAGAHAAAPVSSLTRWAALKAAGSVGAAAGLTLLGMGGGVGFWLGHEVALERVRSVVALEAPAARLETPRPDTRLPDTRLPDTQLPDTQLSMLERRASAEPASSAEAPPSAATGALAPVPPSEAEQRRTEVPPRAHAARRRSEPNPLDGELALLRRVERALRNNDPAFARALLGELDERFPDSRLGEERSAARRIADCRSSEPGASDGAREFLREHRASVYRQRIVLACALAGEPREKGSEAAPMKNVERVDTHVR
jgi:hypothetical protein